MVDCDGETPPAAETPRNTGPVDGLSVFIIACNESQRICSTIEAIRGIASEVIVVDSGSVDSTRELAMARGAKVLDNVWLGYGPQKRFAEDQCQGPWLLNIDADEIVAPNLAEEIRTLFAAGEPPHQAYRVRIAEQFPGEAEPHRFAYTLVPVRLYRKDAGRYNPSPVHDRIDLRTGVSVGWLRHRIHHRSVLSLSQQIRKLNAYSDVQVAEMMARGRRVQEWRILIELPMAFLKAYFMRRHFLRGFYGIATAANIAIARHLRIAKAIEAQRLEEIAKAGQRRPAPPDAHFGNTESQM
jgi:glycosyltransferase involved in cell wall biosynthesis